MDGQRSDCGGCARLLPTCSRARRWRGSRCFHCPAITSATRAPLPSRLRLRAAACRGSTHLHLAANQIGDAGMQALASAFAAGAFRKLENFWIYKNAIGGAGLIAFAAALDKDALPALRRLHLYENNLNDDGVKALMAVAGRGKLQNLETLVLIRLCRRHLLRGLDRRGDRGRARKRRASFAEELSVNLKRRCPRLSAVRWTFEIELITFVEGD